MSMQILLAVLVVLNGNPIDFKEAKPYLEQGGGLNHGQVMVPVVAMARAMGANVTHVAGNGQKIESFTIVTFRHGEFNGVFHVSDNAKDVTWNTVTYTKESEGKVMNCFPEGPIKTLAIWYPSSKGNSVKEKTAYVSVRALADLFDAKVRWKAKTRTVEIAEPIMASNAKATSDLSDAHSNNAASEEAHPPSWQPEIHVDAPLLQ